jgi:hypothetical protein
VTRIPPVADVSVDEQVQRLRDLPGDTVVDDLTRTFGPDLPAAWRPPAEVPRRWLNAYACATADAWSAVSPRWHHAQPLLDLEARRVGAAVVRGCTDVLLNALHPRIRYENGEIWVPSTLELTVGLDGRRLVLVPTIAGGAGRLVGFDLPGVVYLAYPVPGQAGLGERGRASPLPPGADSLDQVLGSARALGGRTAHHGEARRRGGMQPAHDHLPLHPARSGRSDRSVAPWPVRLGKSDHPRARADRPTQQIAATPRRRTLRPSMRREMVTDLYQSRSHRSVQPPQLRMYTCVAGYCGLTRSLRTIRRAVEGVIHTSRTAQSDVAPIERVWLRVARPRRRPRLFRNPHEG